MVHPASDEIAQIGAVQVTVDPDHVTPIPITFVNIFCVDISWANARISFRLYFSCCKISKMFKECPADIERIF